MIDRGVQVVLVALAAASGVRAQQTPDPMNRAFDLERRGGYAAAAEIYRTVLKERPGESAALSGLERSLQPLNRLPEMAGDVSRAVAAAPTSTAVLGVAVRVWTLVKQPDSARAVVERWAAVEPQNEAPFQEWGMAALSQRDRETARTAYQLGRARLKRPKALSVEMAQLATLEGDYANAVTEWLVALRTSPTYMAGALAMLGQTPNDRRGSLLGILEERDSLAFRMNALLSARWGDPIGGFKKLAKVVPRANREAVEQLQQFLEEVRGQNGHEGRLAQAMVLEGLAQRMTGAPASRNWVEAAQAYAEAGDQSSARRMLAHIANDPATAQEVATSATTTLVGVLVEEGKMDDADRQFRALRAALTEDDRDQLTRRVSEGWIRAGRLERAESLVVADSSIEGLAVRGRTRLFRGDITGATKFLRAAGPFAGSREASTERASLLALLQTIEEDSLPALGAALLQLERRDSAGAAATLEAIAKSLPSEGGGAELYLLTGRIRAAMDQSVDAERLLRAAVEPKAPGTAAAAELELGRLWATGKRPTDAVAMLEHLILTYPTSAVVPQARRLLDSVRGGVPPG